VCVYTRKCLGNASGTTSYLSFTVFEQFIEIMGEKVKKTIVNEINNAKYFSIIVDSTPDIFHKDQFAFIFRYVSNNGEPVERFLQFLANSGHKSKDLADVVFMVLEENEIDIHNCADNLTKMLPTCREYILDSKQESKKHISMLFTFHVQHIHQLGSMNVLLIVVYMLMNF